MVDRYGILFHLTTRVNSDDYGGRVPQKRETIQQKFDGRLCLARYLRAAGVVDVH